MRFECSGKLIARVFLLQKHPKDNETVTTNRQQEGLNLGGIYEKITYLCV